MNEKDIKDVMDILSRHINKWEEITKYEQNENEYSIGRLFSLKFAYKLLKEKLND